MTHIKKLITKEPWKAAVKHPKSKDWTEVVSNTTVDVAAGVAGGAGGSFLGWGALPVGIALSALGHSTGHRWLCALGIGIIASPCDVSSSNARMASGTGFSFKDEFEAGKERTKSYIEMLKEKFFINKLTGKNKPADQTSTTTDTTTVNGLDPGVEKATLDKLTEFDQQILSEGIEFQAKKSASPNAEAFSVNGVGIELDDIAHII